MLIISLKSFANNYKCNIRAAIAMCLKSHKSTWSRLKSRPEKTGEHIASSMWTPDNTGETLKGTELQGKKRRQSWKNVKRKG